MEPVADKPKTGDTPPQQPEPDKIIPNKPYGGIGRLVYFFWVIGIFFLGYGIASLIEKANSKSVAFHAMPFIFLLLFFVPTVLRLKNIGDNGWWSLLLFGLVSGNAVTRSFWPMSAISDLLWSFQAGFTQLVGFPAIVLWCLLAPEGYKQHKKFDARGCLLVLALILAYIMLLLILA